DPGAPVVGSVGRLDEPVKGFGVLLSAMARVRAHEPRALCLVVGDGAGRQALQEQAVALGLQDRVRFLGSRADVPRLLQAFALYVRPSRSEGFGLAALEAMAAALPVVATRAGGLPEVVEEGVTGDLVDPGDGEALAQGILGLLRDYDRRLAYSRRGAERARDR